jgi:hypothetical protein
MLVMMDILSKEQQLKLATHVLKTVQFVLIN